MKTSIIEGNSAYYTSKLEQTLRVRGGRDMLEVGVPAVWGIIAGGEVLEGSSLPHPFNGGEGRWRLLVSLLGIPWRRIVKRYSIVRISSF